MKKRIIVLILFILLVLLCACGSSTNKLAGHWVGRQIEYNYPDDMVLNKDGTGSGDGYHFTWYINKEGELVLNGLYDERMEYEIELYNSSLTLDGIYIYDKK